MYFVYMLCNKNKNVLYIGVTNNLERRIYEHENHLIDGFTNKYNVTQLVYYEETHYILDALAREKQLKKWNRAKKEKLIDSQNPGMQSLNEEILS